VSSEPHKSNSRRRIAAGLTQVSPPSKLHSHARPTNIPFPLNPLPLPPTPAAAPIAYTEHAMATERQIQANRANAAKSTGPVTPEGKRIASRNLPARHDISGTVVLKNESIRRFNDLAAALFLQFQPRNSAEISMVQTMTAARWRLLRLWGIQTAGFELEMARQDRSAGSGAFLAAVAFRSLADNSRALALEHRLEAGYDRQYHKALAALLKLREKPDSSAPSYPPIPFFTETWDDDSKHQANSEADAGPTPEHNRIKSE
jgi:hypothetical protein